MRWALTTRHTPCRTPYVHYLIESFQQPSEVGHLPILQMRKVGSLEPCDLPKATQCREQEGWDLNPGLFNSIPGVNAKRDAVLSLVWI